MFDTRPAPYRIIYDFDNEDVHISISQLYIIEQNQSVRFSVLAVAVELKEIDEHWKYIEDNFIPAIEPLSLEKDIRRFVTTKVEILANNSEEIISPYSGSLIPYFEQYFLIIISQKNSIQCQRGHVSEDFIKSFQYLQMKN